jgi:hypothetical protein
MPDNWPKNLLLVLLLGTVTFFTAHQEGYFQTPIQIFALVLIIGLALALWMVFTITTARLLALMLGIFIIEYIKEGIGIRSGMWTYHGLPNTYIIGVWAWVLGGLGVFWMAVRVVIRGIRKLTAGVPRRWNLLNPIVVVLIFLFIPLALGEYGPGAGGWFWSFYAVLFLVALVTAFRMDLPVFLGLVLTTWVMGFLSEYAGSVPDHIWTFTYNPNFPPAFLIIGCWSLEILTQYGLSAFLANEPLDQYTHGERR